MTIDQLNELDLIALEEEFGSHISEEIASCNDLQALLDLSQLLILRISELNGFDNDENEDFAPFVGIETPFLDRLLEEV